MAWRDRQPNQLPSVNLVPMLDVLMTVLTFFIIISMSLTGQQVVGVSAPSIDEESSRKLEKGQPATKFLIGLSKDGELLRDNQTISDQKLEAEIRRFLGTNPNGRIVLKADKSLGFQKVSEILKQLGKIGGKRVSLAADVK